MHEEMLHLKEEEDKREKVKMHLMQKRRSEQRQ